VWVDLHCHSTHSDGTEPPEHVAARAARRGVELFCLTDHDSCDGYPATLGTCANVVRGLELSCSEGGRTVHVLLYDAARDDARWAELEIRLQGLRLARHDRMRVIADRLQSLGIRVDPEPIIASAAGRTVGRPDLARALVAAGAASSMNDAFDRFLGDGKPANVPFERISVASGLALGTSAGARMSLAHPHTLGHLVDDLLRRHRGQGLEGLECYYGAYTAKQRRRWLSLAKKLDLVVTGGSDFHGTSMPQIVEPGIQLPELHARRLQRWLGL
jgi:hypothetical protein